MSEPVTQTGNSTGNADNAGNGTNKENTSQGMTTRSIILIGILHLLTFVVMYYFKIEIDKTNLELTASQSCRRNINERDVDSMFDKDKLPGFNAANTELMSKIVKLNKTVSCIIDMNMNASIIEMNRTLSGSENNLRSLISEMNNTLSVREESLRSSISMMNNTLSISENNLRSSISEMNSTLSGSEENLRSSISMMNNTLSISENNLRSSISEMNSTLSDSEESLRSSISMMNYTLSISENNLRSSISEMNSTLSGNEESLRFSISMLNSTLSVSENNSRSSISQLNTTFSELYSSINLTLLELTTDFHSFMNATNITLTASENHHAEVERFIQETNKTFSEVLSTIEDLTKAKQEAKEIMEQLQERIDRIYRNTFNKNAVITVVGILLVIIMGLVSAVWKLQYQVHRAASSVGSERNMDAHEVLRAIPPAPALQNLVCVISFDSERQSRHRQLFQSLGMQEIVIFHVVNYHWHLTTLPLCKVFLMCAEFSERHVIIEQENLGLGDLKRTTYNAIERLGGRLIIIYCQDPGSQHLDENAFYNRNIYCVNHQPELLNLSQNNRFFSIYNGFTEFQKQSLRNAISAGLN